MLNQLFDVVLNALFQPQPPATIEYFMPVERGKLFVTSPYGERGNVFHAGVDLRCATKGKLDPFQTTEDCEILRMGRDPNDNGFVVFKPLQSDLATELKYIHIKIEPFMQKWKIGDVIRGGMNIGFSEIRGESEKHHLHFETWLETTHFNPMVYLDGINVA